MKKIINGKRYDTSTAKELSSYSYGYPRDFEHWEETLYRKSTGEFFLHGEGGPSSKYAESAGGNCWTGGEKIIPLTLDEAKQWAEKHLDGDEYEEIFGEVEESTEKRTVTFSLPEHVIEAIKNSASGKQMSMSEYIAQLVMADKKEI